MNTRKALQDAATYLQAHAEILRNSHAISTANTSPIWPIERLRDKHDHDDLLAIAEHLLSLVGKPVAQIKAEAAW
jgi:hypothetical protein